MKSKERKWMMSAATALLTTLTTAVSITEQQKNTALHNLTNVCKHAECLSNSSLLCNSLYRSVLKSILVFLGVIVFLCFC